MTPPSRRVHTGQVPVERLLEGRPGMREQLPLETVAHLRHLPRAVHEAYGTAKDNGAGRCAYLEVQL